MIYLDLFSLFAKRETAMLSGNDQEQLYRGDIYYSLNLLVES